MTPSKSAAIAGAGVFGLAAALELLQRGWRVAVADPGPVPHPLASSTDISKVVRMDYGADDFYTDLMEESLRRWDRWNALGGRPLYHETGFLVLSSGEPEQGGFEYESRVRLERRGVPVRRMSAEALRRVFPAWNADRYAGGYFNPRGGYAESGEVVRRLAEEVRRLGGEIHENAPVVEVMESGGRAAGLLLADGRRLLADRVVVAAGAWSIRLVPELAAVVRILGQPVVHFDASGSGDLFAPERFPCWAADITRTGWYGFPMTPGGALKIGHHGPGFDMAPEDIPEVPPEHIERCREFFRESIPAAADLPVVFTRVCRYCDSWDGDFYIDEVPGRPGLVTAAGGSGHAFKFAPVLGELIAARVEGEAHPQGGRFAWRERAATRLEAARAGE